MAKTDRIDAAVIAQFVHRNEVQPKPAPSPAEQTVRDLVTRRNQLVGDQTREQHQARHFSGASLASTERHLAYLKQEIAAVEQELRKVIAQDVSLRERSERLRSVPGVGETLAAALLGSMPELGRLNRAAVGMLAGLAPHARDSGKREGKRFCWGGRATVRTALYMPMLSAVQHNPVIRAFYQRLVDRGKPRKVALTACMRKMLTILNAILREETTWNHRSLDLLSQLLTFPHQGGRDQINPALHLLPRVCIGLCRDLCVTPSRTPNPAHSPPSLYLDVEGGADRFILGL